VILVLLKIIRFPLLQTAESRLFKFLTWTGNIGIYIYAGFTFVKTLHVHFTDVKVFQLNFGANQLPKITGRAKRYARFDHLSEVKPLFRGYAGSDSTSTVSDIT
jgi:hypothetical protein